MSQTDPQLITDSIFKCVAQTKAFQATHLTPRGADHIYRQLGRSQVIPSGDAVVDKEQGIHSPSATNKEERAIPVCVRGCAEGADSGYLTLCSILK